MGGGGTCVCGGVEGSMCKYVCVACCVWMCSHTRVKVRVLWLSMYDLVICIRYVADPVVPEGVLGGSCWPPVCPVLVFVRCPAQSLPAGWVSRFISFVAFWGGCCYQLHVYFFFIYTAPHVWTTTCHYRKRLVGFSRCGYALVCASM
jgi:hypothetical protein